MPAIGEPKNRESRLKDAPTGKQLPLPSSRPIGPARAPTHLQRPLVSMQPSNFLLQVGFVATSYW
jgi:hypothetical protein